MEWVFYSGCQKNVSVFKRFFLQPLMPQFRHWVFSNRVQSTRLHPHRLRHCRAFVFSRRWRKNPSHPLRGWSVTRNIIMENGIIAMFDHRSGTDTTGSKKNHPSKKFEVHLQGFYTSDQSDRVFYCLLIISPIFINLF